MGSPESKLKVLLVVPWDQESGGVAAVVGYLAGHLQSQGHQVLFLHPGPNNAMRQKITTWGYQGVEIKLRVPFNPNFPLRSVISFVVTFPFTIVQLMRLIQGQRIRVVNIHYPGEQFVYFAFCRWLMRIRLVISIHGMDAMRWEAASNKPSRPLAILFRAADLVVAPSWRFLRRCDELLAPFSARRLAIHNGTDLTELSVARAEEQRPFVLTVCSLDPWKGVDVLIRAIAFLRDAGVTTHLVVAGDGPERASLQSLIDELGLQSQVQLIGQQPRAAITRLLQQCTVFVLASRFETFGIAALEAMACGKPVVGTSVDGILEIVDDGENGLIVSPDDPRSLAAALDRLLADASLRRTLGTAARARVREQFHRERMGQNYMQIFQELVANV